MLDISERRIGPITLVELTGRLIAEAGDHQFKAHIDTLVSAGSLNILVDLRNVSYMDSAGVGAIVSTYLHVFKRGGRLKLLCPSERVDHLLRITHLTSVFELFDDENEAVRSFDAPSPAFI